MSCGRFIFHVDRMLWGQWNLSADKAKNYKLYNELCNLSKYCYAMKWGLTKRNYTKYTKKSDTNVKTTEKKFKYKISYPHPKCQKIG